MEISADILAKLTCAECNLVLSHGPVFQSHDGAALCGRCVRADRPSSRNQLYEAVAQLLRFPCRNRELGCTDTVPFTLDHEDEHEGKCAYRQYACPVVPRGQCKWKGETKEGVLRHCEVEHRNKILKNGASLTPSIKTTNQTSYLLHVFYNLFIVDVKVCIASGKILYSVRYLGPTEKARRYTFTVDIKRGKQIITKSSSVTAVAPGSQDDTAMTLHINSLLQVLDGFSGAQFVLTVWDTQGCTKCKTELKKYQYSDVDGWLCEKCTPNLNIKDCMNEDENTGIGCSHDDLEIKLEKHNLYFCPHVYDCTFCEEFVGWTPLVHHYVENHYDYESDKTFRHILVEDDEKFFIRSSEACMTIIRFLKKKHFLRIELQSPLSYEDLRNYFCELTVTNHVTKKSKTYKQNVICTKAVDWQFDIHKNDFTYYKNQFDIRISFKNVESD